MTVSDNMKGDADSDELTENYHLHLQLPLIFFFLFTELYSEFQIIVLLSGPQP